MQPPKGDDVQSWSFIVMQRDESLQSLTNPMQTVNPLIKNDGSSDYVAVVCDANFAFLEPVCYS